MLGKIVGESELRHEKIQEQVIPPKAVRGAEGPKGEK